MEKQLSREEVLHVAELARIDLEEEDIAKYQVHLKQLFDYIDKIKEIENSDDTLLISPVDDLCSLRSDEPGEMLELKETMKNVPKSSGSFVEVPVMISE